MTKSAAKNAEIAERRAAGVIFVPFQPLLDAIQKKYPSIEEDSRGGNNDPHVMPCPLYYLVCGISPSEWFRSRKAGEICETVADKIACNLKLHPWHIWLDWYELTARPYDNYDLSVAI